jgi:uncharacterized membrane-anchored protein
MRIKMWKILLAIGISVSLWVYVKRPKVNGILWASVDVCGDKWIG